MNVLRSICCLLLLTLGSGCAGWGRASMFPPPGIVPAETGVATPSQVTPQTDPLRTNKPAEPAPAATPDQSNETFKTPQPKPNSSSPVVPQPQTSPEERESSPVPREDNWRPSSPVDRAEPPRTVEPPQRSTRSPARGNPSDVELGQPAPFPTLPQRGAPATKPEEPVEEERGRPIAQGIANVSEARPVDKPHRPTGWELTLQSTGQRPLQVATASSGQRGARVFLTGSMSGLETESVKLLDEFVELLTTGPLPQSSLSILRTPNPDGIAEHTRTNLNGVDLNRNFPSTRFTAIPNQLTGPHPASELETQHVMRLLRDFAPTRVIHVRSSFSSKPLVMFNKRAAQTFAKGDVPEDVDYAVYAGEFKAGSLEEFASLRLDAEVITILLPLDGFRSLQAAELLKFVDLQSSADATGPRTELATVPESKSEAVDPAQSQAATGRPDGELGFVELLPPPPHVSASAGGEVEDPRYYELPPPPLQ
ncbi:MAG: hypothetical protein KDA90_06355 [Planctomycetaceae bacterium]|nr:hypothetical protein [Planctomycetaceae bacterium]